MSVGSRLTAISNEVIARQNTKEDVIIERAWVHLEPRLLDKCVKQANKGEKICRIDLEMEMLHGRRFFDFSNTTARMARGLRQKITAWCNEKELECYDPNDGGAYVSIFADKHVATIRWK